MSSLPNNWFNPDMVLGESQRHTHICSKGGDKPVVVTRTHNGWAWWCHRCRIGGNENIAGCSPEITMKWLKSLRVPSKKDSRKLKLPIDYTIDLPAPALAYCYSRGLTSTDIAKYKIGYSLYYHRLVIPIYNGKELIFWEGRNLGEVTRDNPKYIKRKVKSWDRVIFEAGPEGGTYRVVITEDIISAINVGRTTDCKAVLSTHIDDQFVFDLSKSYKEIFIWLDPDKRAKMIGLVFKYRAYGINFKRIESDKDPKWYSDSEIKEKIERCGGHSF